MESLYLNNIGVFELSQQKRRARRAPSAHLMVTRESAHTSQSPRIGHSHSFVMPARCLLRVRSVALFEFSISIESRSYRGRVAYSVTVK